jgi:hypothetical protein
MFKVVEKVEVVFPVCEISHVKRLVKEENKVLVHIYRNRATFLIFKIDEFFFYGFDRDIHSKSTSLEDLLVKQLSGINDSVTELYLFDSMKEFFTVAEQQGWDY